MRKWIARIILWRFRMRVRDVSQPGDEWKSWVPDPTLIQRLRMAASQLAWRDEWPE